MSAFNDTAKQTPNIPTGQTSTFNHSPNRPQNKVLDILRPIQSALGIQTNDILRTSYNSGPFIVHQIHGPFTHFECTNSIVILDHPEISLTLLSPGASKKRAGGYINNIRQVGDSWLTAQNDELFVTRPEPAYVEPATLFDIFDPPNQVEILPIQSPYQLDPLVDYESGPRHTWRCEACHTDFNAVPSNQYWCKHNCGSDGALPHKSGFGRLYEANSNFASKSMFC